MKRFLPVLAVISTSAFAQDLMLSDLNYFQKQSSVLVNTSLNLGSSESKLSNEKTDGDSTVWSNAVTYGLSDKLNLGLEFDYALKNESKSGTDKATDDKGLSDFTVTGAYRLMDSGTYVDLIGGLTVATGDRENGSSNATQSNNGNFKEGHNSVELGTAVGQKNGQFEWRAGLSIDHHLSGDYKDLDAAGGAAETNDTDSYTNYSVFGQAQYRLDKFVVGLNFDYTMNGEQVRTEKSSSTKTTIDSYSTLTTGVSARYDLSSTVVLNVGYAMLNNFDIEGTQGTTAFKQEDNKASVVAVGATLLF